MNNFNRIYNLKLENMPPLKLYVFVRISNPTTFLTIKAYNFIEAMDELISITRNIDDFKLINQ